MPLLAHELKRPLGHEKEARYVRRQVSDAWQPSIRIDPVAHFHLGNGARLERINWLGNTAPRGFQESFGIMVNYLYDRDTINDKHEAFVRDGTVVRSPEIDALLQS
jgi:malonyl-CoA decarboxylase